MDGGNNDSAQSTSEKQFESKKTPGGNNADELDSLLDSAIDDFDKYQSSNVDTGRQENAASSNKEAIAESEAKPFQPELPPLPPDQEAFFNAIFNNQEAQQMFSGMNEAFAGMMSSFEQMAQDPELKNEMDTMMQNTFAMMAGGVPPSTGDPSSTGSTKSTHLPSGTTEPEGNEGEDLAKTLGETLQKLAESAKDVKDGNIPQEEMMKAFENLNMEGGEEVLLPMVQNMMENLLSKDVLYPSLKEVTDKYPQWLEENKSKLAESDYERYCKQQGTMCKVCKEYEEEEDSDPPEVKKERIMKIMNLIQEMESYGEPPKEIVGDMPSTGLQFDEKGLPKIPGMPPGEQCSVM